jgi:hypothetical protein
MRKLNLAFATVALGALGMLATLSIAADLLAGCPRGGTLGTLHLLCPAPASSSSTE